jgi:hypothetical protein
MIPLVSGWDKIQSLSRGEEEYMEHYLKILWRIDPLLIGDSLNSGHY